MKRTILALAALLAVLLATPYASAQSYYNQNSSPAYYQSEKSPWQTHLSVGFFSFQDFIGALVCGLGSIDLTEGTSSSEATLYLNPSVDILYTSPDTPWLSYGGSLSVGYAAVESRFDDTGELSKSAKALYPTLSFITRTRYIESGDGFSFYGHYGVGLTAFFVQQSSQEGESLQPTLFPSLSIYPACLAWNDEEIGIFVELGWGSRGLVNVGVNLNF